MSQYSSMPPPGAYVPPNQNQSTQPQGYGTQQQQQDYQQLQAPTTYQPSGQGYSQPSQSNKASVGTFGSMVNQAVTTSKPMLGRLSKTISSRLGNKHSTPGTPQHLQSYQNYQQHYNQPAQTYGQQQSQAFSPQGQQTQQQPQAPGAYPPQQPPYQHYSYGSVQGNQPTPQASPVPHVPYTQVTPTPQQPPHSSYNASQFGQGGNTADENHAQAQQGQHQQGQMGQTPAQGQYPQQPMQAQYSGQQTGVVGGSGHSEHPSNPQSPQNPISSPGSPIPQNPQWANTQTGSEQSFTSVHQQQLQTSAASAQLYFPTANAQVQAHVLPHSQQWTPLSATGSDGQTQNQLPPASMSPPPPPPIQSKPSVVSSVSPLHSQSPTPAPQHSAAPSGPPTEFIAELPADMGSLSLIKSKSQDQSSVQPVEQTSPYQAYQSATVQTGPTSPGFTIARRAVSVSNMPYADPWRFADPLTELPTREFYVIADLLFDALDRKFEPQNTGMLEASKVLKSWIDLSEDATQLFSYKLYSAFGRMWSLEGIPHVMVPLQPTLSPIWNFNQHSHAHELKLLPEHEQTSAYAEYIPALNRAGWYKFFFLEMMHCADNINKLIPALCSETYKPGVLHHPDLTKRDKAEAPALQARAAQLQSTVINQVCNEIKTAMLAEPNT